MAKLTYAIKQLEQEITQSRQAIHLQFEHTKTQLTAKLKSPPIFLLAFITGGLLGKQVKRSLTKKRHLQTSPTTKLSFVKKMVSLSSEISVAINLYHRFKAMAGHLIKKTNSTMSTHTK